MIDFFMVSTRSTKRGTMEIYPKFIVKKSSDLMIRGGDFYAIWMEDRGLWSTDEQDALHAIDNALDEYADEFRKKTSSEVKVLHLWDAETGMIDAWHKYCQKQMFDSFNMLDEQLVFANTETNKKDYASKKLNYPLEPGSLDAYEEIITTLYSDEERHKIEWAIGSILSGDSKKLQKFMVLYGAAGTGKSTILNIIQQLFDGYYSVFDAKALGSSSNTFALESFKTNPLVAIQHDGDLSKIEDNTRLNSLVSHELMTVNEKFKSTYSNSFKSFLFMGTNKPVKITDAKSGLIRRLIDVTPTGNKLAPTRYHTLMKKVDFEIGAIAYHCREVYLNNPGAYESYIPVSMLGASNDFYNFVSDSYFIFKKEDSTTLKAAWEMYKNYCDEAKVPYPYSQRNFKEELKNYFRDYKERFTMDDGTRVRNYYTTFRWEQFEDQEEIEIIREIPKEVPNWLDLQENKSIFDQECCDLFAQYANENDTPLKGWAYVKSKLSSLDTSLTHYVKVPIEHIVIDFDCRDEDGNKSLKKCIEAASTWPETYAEVSKGGGGLHLHYIYTGDPMLLSRVYDDHIEVKIYNGGSALRRRLSKCNTLSIASISTGLPLKEAGKIVNLDAIKSEKGLRIMIKKNLNKEFHAYTKPSLDFINKLLNDAYDSGMKYDVSDMRNAVLSFAINSSNNSDYCVKLVKEMKFKSEEVEISSIPVNVLNVLEDDLVFYDVEVFPNLFLVNWKVRGKDNTVVRMINPRPIDIESLLKFKLVGFNCRRYDNHIMYARMMGYTNEQLYTLSQRIISGSSNCFFSEAYNLSFTDVYDYCSAGNKMSLKKWEIELGIHHHELGLPWDQPVPEELWPRVAEYCDDDVIATEAVFDATTADWTARKILADLAGLTYNDTTNTLTTRIIFGKNRKPQDQFNYRDMSKPVLHLDPNTEAFLKEAKPKMMEHWTIEKTGSKLPYFPGYTYKMGKSLYKGVDPKEGGYAEGRPDMYGNVALLDVASMHPNSAICEVLFGVEFTKRFKEIVDGRVSIKHEAWDIVDKMLGGVLRPYIELVKAGKMTSKDLANALKTAINSVYGLTSAKFTNAFRDDRNIDNIVAKRGALFMIDLVEAVEARGFKVAHIKTDSIKIPDATPEIIEFVKEFGSWYGYDFEHEATYDRMCLVNDAVYIAKYATPEKCMELYGYIPDDNKKKGDQWTATGTQFAVPYVFKKLFSKEDILFNDMCETKSVKTAIYLDMDESIDPALRENASMFETVRETRNNPTQARKRDLEIMKQYEHMSDEEIIAEIEKGHDYKFVGKVSSFCPIKDGRGGGELLRENGEKYSAVTGSKGYRWLEAETVKELGKENDVDRSYYDSLVNDAAQTIIAYGNFEWFVSDDPYIGPPFVDGHPDYEHEVPFN